MFRLFSFGGADGCGVSIFSVFCVVFFFLGFFVFVSFDFSVLIAVGVLGFLIPVSGIFAFEGLAL